MDIRLIKTEDDYTEALDELEKLMDRDIEPNTPEGDQYELLSVLVEKYEDEHYPIPLPDPIAAIEYYIESRGLSRADLEPFIGTRARVSEILNKKRALSLRMVRNLSDGLGIPAEILIQGYKLNGENDLDEDNVITVKFTHENALTVNYIIYVQNKTVNTPPVFVPEFDDISRFFQDYSMAH